MMALWFFLALAIPLVVHIFSRSEGKVMPFPFLGLLPKQAAPNELQIQLRQKWLLLMRLLLVASACALLTLALLSNLLSDSWLKQSLAQALTLPPSPATVVITQDWWEVTDQEDQQALLSALTNEQSFAQTKEVILIHYANAQEKISRIGKLDFIKLVQQNRVFLDTSSNGGAAHNGDPSLNSAAHSNANKAYVQLRLIDNIWSLVQAISTTLPVDSVIHIYTSNRYSQFIGARAHINQATQWHINNIPDAAATEREPIEVGILRDNSLSTSSQMSFLLEQALAALALVHPINIDIIETYVVNAVVDQALVDNANPKLLDYAGYDTVFFDSALTNKMTDYSNFVSLSSLPQPNEIEFIGALGQAVFSRRQHELALFSRPMLNQQIEGNTGASINNAVVVSALPNNKGNPWESTLTLVLVVLFVAERRMSESLKFAHPTTAQNHHG